MSQLLTSEKREDKKGAIQTYDDGLERAAARVAGNIATTDIRRRQFSVTVVSSGDDMYKYVIERRISQKK